MAKEKMKWLKKTALVLAAVGAINWGLNELGWNAVNSIVGLAGATAVTVVYYAVGISGVYALYKVFNK